MKIIKLISLFMITALCGSAHAYNFGPSSTGPTAFRPGATSAFLSCSGSKVILNLQYIVSGDVGKPGVTYVSIVEPNEKAAVFANHTGGWTQYLGGMYPPNGAYDGGLPAIRTISIDLSGIPFVDRSLYVGHGALGQEELSMVRDRRIALDAIKPDLVAQGKWKKEYHENDDMMKLSLAEKNMRDKNKYFKLMILPSKDCE